MQVIKGVMVLSNSLTLDIIALSPESVRQADLEQNSSFGLSFSVRPESHDASNMKGSFFFQEIICYRLLDAKENYLFIFILKNGAIKTNLALNNKKNEVWVCVFVLQVCVNAACVPAEKFHSGCIILSVGSFPLLLSHSVLDDCVSECVCLCAPCLLGPCSTQRRSECTLRSHIVLQIYEDASISSVSSGRKATCVVEEGTSYQSKLNNRCHTAPTALAEPRTAKQQEEIERRSQNEEYSESNLSRGPLSNQCCLCCPLLLEGAVRWGLAYGRAGSQLVTLRDGLTKPKEAVLMELVQGLAC